ncbi:MAG: hypothetical protein AAF909_00520 [Pseudomonadota bacterium]
MNAAAAPLSKTPYAAFLKAEVAPPSEAAQAAIAAGPYPPHLFPPLERAPSLVARRNAEVPTGFALRPDGEVRVFDRTPMPGVSPEMWTWWFGWHGDAPGRYQLWHPKAHVAAVWVDGAGDTGAYLGRESHITEYLGGQKVRGSIRFVPPAELGIDEAQLKARGEICICGRIGPQFPKADIGWLVHHVYPTSAEAGAQSSEMQSYFWLAGPHLAARSGGAWRTSALRAFAKLTGAARQIDPAALLAHCSEEMAHLATILPGLYAEYGPKGAASPSTEKEIAQ